MIISIVSSIYNGAKFFPQLIESIKEQNLPADDYEIVITDNASTDDTTAVVNAYVEKYPKLPLRLVRLEKNVGPGGGRNSGIKNAKGDFIINIDSDDEFLPNSLREIYEILKQNPTLDLLQFDYVAVENGIIKELSHFDGNSKEIMNGEDYIINQKIPNTPWCYAYKRSFLLENSIFYAENVRFEDTDFVIKATLKAKKILYCEIPVIKYNWWHGMGSRIGTNKSHLIDFFKISERIKNLAFTLQFTSEKSRNVVINIHQTTTKFIIKHFLWRFRRKTILEMLKSYPPYFSGKSGLFKFIYKYPGISALGMSICRPILNCGSKIKQLVK